MERIAVLGAGNGGYAIAADLALAGHAVSLYDLPEFEVNLAPVRYAGGIQITGVARTGFARIERATTDLGEAVTDAEFIFVSTVANAHERIATLLAPVLRDGHLICLTPGSGGTLVLAREFRAGGVRVRYALAETFTLPYACRRLNGPGTVNVHRVVRPKLPTGVFPALETDAVIARLRRVYPTATPTMHVLEAALYNLNLMVHPVGTLLNVGRIEYTKGDFWLYKEGFTPSVFRLMAAQDEEKCALLRALGCEGRTYDEFNTAIDGMSFDEFARLSSKGPSSVRDRYVTEDVPNGLVLMSSLGMSLDVPTPVTDALILFFSIINDTNYRGEGRTLERVGLANLTPRQVIDYLNRGVPPPTNDFSLRASAPITAGAGGAAIEARRDA